MGVTIDSLQIEIKSSSTNAAKGIDDLALSLEKLKKNGSFKTVSTNLDRLSESLKKLPNVHGASNALRTLANSIEKLKGVGSVASLTNSLAKLPAALNGLQKINLENVALQAQKVATAVAPLSAIKSGGLNTMITGMKKLGEVTKSLDDETIRQFAQKVELLNQKLGPLSEKMTAIKAGFSSINTKARSASSGVKEFDHGVNTSTLNMSSFISVVQTGVQMLHNLILKFSEFMNEAIEWDGIAARFGRGFGGQAEETYAWIQRLNEEMGINVQQFMKYSSVYATMLKGFGVAHEDATKMALGYTELTYDIWAGYNDIYKSFDEASEAVKSAIAGEVEPIRRAGFTIVESTLEQTAANHGLEISLHNATEAQKSYLRYLTLVDQAHAQDLVGTYAKELQTAEGLMRTFAQQLKSLTQAFGSLFLPILTKVMPYLQAFVELLTDAVHWVAALFGVTIQPVDWSGYNSGVSDAVENTENVTGALDDATAAAKELKNATLGIDELNVISPPSASSGSGSGSGSGDNGFAGLDVDSLWDESIFDTIQTDVDQLKEKLKNMMPLIAGIATALAGWKLTQLLDDLEVAGFKLGNLGRVISVAGISLAVGKLVWDFTGAYLEGGKENDLLEAFGTTVLGVALARWLGGKPGAAFTLLVSGVVTLSRLGVALAEGTVEWNDTESLVTGLLGGIETILGAVFTWKTLAPIVKKLWPKVTAAAAPVLSAAAPYIALAAAVVGGITLALVDYDFTDIGRTIGEKIGKAIRTAGEWIGDGIKAAFTWVVESLDIDSVWDALAVLFVPVELFRRIAPEIGELFTNLSDWFNEKIENFKENINEFFDGLFLGIFDGLDLGVSFEKLVGKIDHSKIIYSVINPMSIGKNIIEGIIDGIKSLDIWDSVKSKFSDFVDKVKSFFGIKSPSTLMRDQIGKNLVSGIVSGMNVNGIRDKLSSMWNSAKTWWNEKKGSLKTYTPSIGSIYDKLKPRWDNARTWWNEKKSAMKTYTPSIGSIYEKVKERWDNARNWWNGKKAAMKTYTPSIGSIKDKIVSAWNTAKSWWSKNAKLSAVLDVKVPKISVKWDSVEAFGKSFRYPTGFSLKFAANGGIFDQGSLIWAGERGPEVMARAAGGKTGVMNVQQMQDAVYEGVYAAVSAAMSGKMGGGSQDVRVYIDGREVHNTVKKYAHEGGATIMGNEVYGY